METLSQNFLWGSSIPFHPINVSSRPHRIRKQRKHRAEVSAYKSYDITMYVRNGKNAENQGECSKI